MIQSKGNIILMSNNIITENNQYKQQLWNDLKCESIQISSLNKLQYIEKSLIDFFIEYNKVPKTKAVKEEKFITKNILV